MGLGREVADAYISVHGDLAPFRRELDSAAANKKLEDLAKKNADTFSEAWGKRMADDVGKQWNGVLDTIYKGQKIDLNKMMESFNSSDMDVMQEKMNKFLLSMRRHQKLSAEEYKSVKKALNEEIDGMRLREELDNKHLEALKLNSAWEQRRADTMAEAAKENERWARTLDGIRKNNSIKDLENDFRRLAGAMSSADMGEFAKSFDNLHKARARIYEVTAAMEQQGRMSAEQAAVMHAHIDQFINDEKAKSDAMRASLDETKRLREAQDRYNQSLAGMARNIHFGNLESQFRNLAAAMDSNDFSAFARGATNIEQMRRKIAETASEMHRLGRMTDTEYGLVLERVDALQHTFSDGNKNGTAFFRILTNGAKRFNGVLGRLTTVTRGFREHLGGFAGINVFGDIIREGLDFIHNLDRIAVKAGKAMLSVSLIGSAAVGALASAVTIAGDLGSIIGGLGVALPAFLIGSGIGISVMVAAFKDMKTVLSDLKPMFAKLQDDISADFWREAAGPIREMVKTIMPLIDNPKGTSTARSLGKVFGRLATAIKEVPADHITTMFDRMNDAIDILGGAMKPLVHAFDTLGMVGSKYFGRFSTWIVKLSKDFDEFINKSAKNGNLDKWIENMISGFKDLGRAFDGAFGIFNAIDSAASRAGFGGLRTFADNLQRAAAAMQTVSAQKTLTTYFSGVLIFVEKVGAAIGRLGPAVSSIAPTINLALSAAGDGVATLIGYIGQVLQNPAVQKGITDFTNGIKTAIERLEPAIKPFSDSLGNALTLLGQIAINVADVATAFTVNLAPVLDKMSAKMGQLVEPLKDSMVKFLEAMKGPLETLNTQFVGPMVDGIKGSLLPAFDDFVKKFAPFASKVIEDLAPSFKILVDNVLPNFVRLAGELLDPLGKIIGFLTPTLATTLTKVGDGFRNITDGIKVLKGELALGDTEIFKNLFDSKKIAADAQKAHDEVTKNMSGGKSSVTWGQILSDAFWGNVPPDVFWSRVWTKVGPSEAGAKKWDDSVGKWLEGARSGIMDAINNYPSFEKELNKGVNDWLKKAWENDQTTIDEIDTTVNKWFDDNVFKPMGELGKTLGKLWDDTIGKFFDGIFGGGAGVTSYGGGSGPGGKGRGVSGKLDPAMLGLPDEGGVTSWFENFGTWLSTGFNNAMAKLGEALGLSDFGAKWDEMWTGMGTSVSTAWDTITTWLSTKFMEIKTNVDLFIADFKLNWDLFWSGLGPAVQAGWDAVVLWITTKATEIKTNIDLFIAGVKLNWDLFWSGIGTKVSETWNAIVLWITTKVTEIRTNITTFITNVKAGWDAFWAGVFNKVSETWNKVSTWITTKVTEIRTNITNFITTVKANWDAFWNTVNQKVSAIWNTITGFISGKANAIRANIMGFIASVKSNWDSFWNTVNQKVTSAWNSIKNGISNGVNAAVEYVRSLPGKITGALGNLGGLLLGAGNAIMDGLRRGLEGAWQGVKDFVGTIAQWIAEHKGPISYDRKLLVPAGEAIMQGLQAGLGNEMGSLLRTLNAVTDTMTSAVTDAFARSKMYLAGADAALGLADGLSAKKSTVAAALGAIVPDASLSARITARGTGGVGGPTPTASKVVNFAEGAIKVTTPTQSPELVAKKTLDEIVRESSNF